ncbi:DinB family protein [Oceanobacillus senegalensis]|uniref:DinB family protein n=1 Tax=Oceanobacillus senegalensis TaxID=1936063 RepID=UPI000A313721|nr:DinB family protein [Oceanobacillus senegalensis]
MKSKYIESYFQLVESQRKVFYGYIDELGEAPWKRPLPEKWSIGESLYHLMLMVRLVRRISIFYFPIMLPYAHFRSSRPYKTKIHNIYEEYNQMKRRPMKAPFLLMPPKNLSQKYQFTDVQELLTIETTKLKEKVINIDERVTGQIRYPDPIAYYPNVIQSIQLLAIHEQHHFDLMKKYNGNKR